MEGKQTSRFNVVIRIRPILGDEENELTTEDDMFNCVKRLVYIINRNLQLE